jgi:hypothetical protein
MGLRQQILSILSESYTQTDSEALTRIKTAFEAIKKEIQRIASQRDYRFEIISTSFKREQLVKIPWIALFTFNESSSKYREIFVILLFKADLSGFYLTVNLGGGIMYSAPLPNLDFLEDMETGALELSRQFRGLIDVGFSSDRTIDLGDAGNAAKAHERSTVVYKYYDRNRIPPENQIEKDITAVLDAYEKYIGKLAKPNEISKMDSEVIVQQSGLKEIISLPEQSASAKVIQDILEVLEDKKSIEEAENLLIAKLSVFADKKGIISVGYQGASERLSASWSNKLGIWWITEKSENRFWNAFGTREPKWASSFSHNIVCEINPPFEGINRSISGIFAEDPSGKLYLLHRGRIGGGRVGIGKSKFEDDFNGDWSIVRDGIELSRVALIAAFDSPLFAESVSDFVHQVEAIKISPTKATAVKAPISIPNSFKEEFYGKRKTQSISSKYEAECTHGLIVSRLRKLLIKKGLTIVNNVAIDLLSIDLNGKPLTLFEVKTDCSTTNIYGAIGQLLYHSTNLSEKCTLVAVFPKDIDNDTKAILQKMKIKLLTYEWVDNLPLFDSTDLNT